MPEIDKELLACLDGRCETLDTTCWAYPCKLATGQRYGMDVAFSGAADIDEKRMSVWIPFADGNRRDGVGDLLEVEGIDTNRHRKNPIILFDHGKEVKLPVALAEDPDTKAYTVEIDPVSRTARANAFFYQGKGLDSTTPSDEYTHAVFCEQLFDLLARRFIRAGSIGYQVVAAKQLQPDYERGTPQGLHLLRVLMLECSAVVLPANGDTVRKMFGGQDDYNAWTEGMRQVLAMPQVCGKPLSPYLVKSLEPFALKNKTVVGYEEKGLNEDQIVSLGEWLSEHKDPAPMPGYGQIFVQYDSGRVWYVGGDGDEDGFVQLVNEKLGSVEGVTKVTCEAEGFPPKDEDWVQVYPKKKEWVKGGLDTYRGNTKAQPSDDISPDKAREILRDGTIHGKPLTDKQRRMFGAAAGRSKGSYLNSRQDYDNPLSRSDVPPSRWKPGAGAIKEVRAKYRKKYVNVEFFRDRTQARQFADDLTRKRCKVSRFTQDPKTGQWGVYWDTNCGTSSVEQAGEYEDTSNRSRGEPTTYRRSKSALISEVVTNASVRRVLQAAGITPKAVSEVGNRLIVVVSRGRFDEAYKVLFNNFESVAADYNAIYVYFSGKSMSQNKAMAGDEDLRKRAYQAFQAARNQFLTDPGFWTGSPERSELDAAIDQASRIEKPRERAEGLRKFAEACRRLAPKAPNRSSRVSLEKAARHAESAVGLYGQLEDFYRMNRKSLDSLYAYSIDKNKDGTYTARGEVTPNGRILYAEGRTKEEAKQKLENLSRQVAGSKGMDDIRLKYRPGAKGRMRRLRKSSPGSALVYVSGKDLSKLRQAAEAKGISFSRAGVKGDLEKVRLTGDDTVIDGIAKQFGKIVKSITTMKRKDMAEDNGTMNGTQAPAGDADLNDDGMVSEQEAEKYGAQLLRDMHEVFQELMGRWDKARGPLEQAKVDGHLEKVLTNLGDHLDKTEDLFEELYADLDPLSDDKDMDTMDDEGTPADSDDERDEEEPTHEEAVEGMNTKRNKRIKVKAMPIQTKAKKKKGGKDSQWGARYQGAYEWAEENNVNDPEGTAAAIANGPKHLYYILTKSVCPDCGVADCKCGSKDMTQDEAQNLKEDLTEQVNDSELEPHEKRMVKEAVGFLGEVAETPEWTEEHRMKSYHYHKGLDPIGMLEEGIDAVTGQEEAKDLTEDEAEQISGDMTEQVEDTETKSARKMCKDCSAFFKELSAVTELADDHRTKAMNWHKQLGPFGEEAMDGEPDAMGSDDEPTPIEPGDMDTKALLSEVAEQDRLIKEMEKKLASISF